MKGFLFIPLYRILLRNMSQPTVSVFLFLRPLSLLLVLPLNATCFPPHIGLISSVYPTIPMVGTHGIVRKGRCWKDTIHSIVRMLQVVSTK